MSDRCQRDTPAAADSSAARPVNSRCGAPDSARAAHSGVSLTFAHPSTVVGLLQRRAGESCGRRGDERIVFLEESDQRLLVLARDNLSR